MAKTSIYLPDDLAEQVRAYGISISEVAQQALSQAVRNAQIKEKVMIDIQAVADRLKGQRAATSSEDAARAVKTWSYGEEWARTAATAEELNYVAGFDGQPDDYSIPISLVLFVSDRNRREWLEEVGLDHPGMPSPTDVPVRPEDPSWADLQGAVREVWDAVRPLLGDAG